MGSGWSMMTLFLTGEPPSNMTCPLPNFTAQCSSRGPGKSGPGWDASPSGDTYSLVASLLPFQPPRTNNLPFTGTLALCALLVDILDKGAHELVALGNIH